MDIPVNENVEKVRFKDLFSSLKDILFGNNNSVDDNELNKKIEEIRKVEAEIGGTASIEKLIKAQQTYITDEKSKKRRTSTKLLAKKPEIKEDVKVIEDEEREI